MKRKYPVIDMARTGQNIENVMRLKGFTVKDFQNYLELSTPQSIYHWFDGRNLPTIDNLYSKVDGSSLAERLNRGRHHRKR